MKKIILFQLLMLISIFSFGQSVLIEPATSTKRFVVKSIGGTYGHFSTTFSSGADLYFKLSATGDGSAGINIGRISTFSNRFELAATGATMPLAFVTNSVERMRIDVDGKIGVGISSPVSNLHIHQPTAATSYLRLSNTDTGTATSDGLEISMSNNDYSFGYEASIMNREAGSLSLGTNNLTRFYINSAGNITVGAFSGSAGLGRMIIEGNSSCCGAGNNFSTLTLHESDTEGSRLTFTNNNSSTNQRFWTVYGNPKTAGDEANAEMNFFYVPSVGVGNNVLRLLGNGNAQIAGFTKLGGVSAPAIKMKSFTNTTSNVEGGDVFFAHGLDSSKILSYSVLVDAGGIWVKEGHLQFAGRQFDSEVNAVNVRVYNHPTNSENILSKTIKVLITYTE